MVGAETLYFLSRDLPCFVAAQWFDDCWIGQFTVRAFQMLLVERHTQEGRDSAKKSIVRRCHPDSPYPPLVVPRRYHLERRRVNSVQSWSLRRVPTSAAGEQGTRLCVLCSALLLGVGPVPVL